MHKFLLALSLVIVLACRLRRICHMYLPEFLFTFCFPAPFLMVA